MATTPESPETQHGLLSGMGPDDWTNANTITKWLLNQPHDSRPGSAQAIFDNLLQDASQSRQYHNSGQACVKLCSFVQQCAKSSDQALKQWAYAEDLTLRLFHFYLEWYEHDPHRALRMVLDILVSCLTQSPCHETRVAVKDHVLETLVLVVSRKYPKLVIKAGLQCLDHLFTKQAIRMEDLVCKYRQTEPELANSDDHVLWRSLVLHLFSWMELSYVSSLAGKAIIHIFRSLLRQASSDPPLNSAEGVIDMWLGWLRDALDRNPEILEDVKNYGLVPLFKTDRTSALIILRKFNSSDSLDSQKQKLTDLAFMLQLATLDLGKRFGLVEEPSSSVDDAQSASLIILQESLLDGFLSHPSMSVRCSALSLLVSSQATTKPFSETAFALLRRHLGSFHMDYDAKFRNEMLGLTKNFIRRVKGIVTVAKRSIAAQASRSGQQPTADSGRPVAKRKPGPEDTQNYDQEASEILSRHEGFLKWYMDFLKGELLPTASYQRHITAIKATLLALKIGKHAGAPDELDMDIMDIISSDPAWTRLVLDLLLDPFDDVRDGASAILSLFPREIVEAKLDRELGFNSLLDALLEFNNKAKSLADRTGRADHGDGAARSQGLMCRWLGDQTARIDLVFGILQILEVKIPRAEADLGHAAIENPVHGDFASLSYVWQVLATEIYGEKQLEKIHQIYTRVSDCSKRIWAAVRHVLCDDSPEGHLPEEMEEIEGLDTKDLLSYSFRAVHESSNLMRLMIGTLRLEPAPGVPFPPLDIFKDIGFLTFEQLATLRHRGAFSTVSLTFTTCCQLTQRLERTYVSTAGSDNLLREWYQGALQCIETQASTTRRSAGIPSLIAGILSANSQSPSFGEVFAKLEEIGQKPARVTETDGSNLPQVHALNCLRGVFRSSLLSKKAESYLASNLQLASNSLKSEVWAIRNCGLLLLRSLIDCLLGTGESKATIESGWDGHSVRISYNKYPTLPGVILGLLQPGVQAVDEVSSSAAEAVFPALDIIRRAGPPDEYREELRVCIEGYLGSKIWHVREMAARTLCSFLLQTDWVAELGAMLGSCGAEETNRLHGVLLTARFIIERKLDLTSGTDLESEALGMLLSRARDAAIRQRCPEVQAAYLEIVNLLAGIQSPSSITNITEPPSSQQPSGVLDISTPKEIRYSALLDMQNGLRTIYDISITGDTESLRSHLFNVLNSDVNTAHRMLESLPTVWRSRQGSSSDKRLEFCEIYGQVCIQASSAPEIRAQALLNLGSLMDESLRQNELSLLPDTQFLEHVWNSLQDGIINPELSCAAIKASGTFMAAFLARDAGDTTARDKRLRGWGAMVADSLDIDNDFDTRYAAVAALESFFGGTKVHDWTTSYLPALSALYDGLIDDDDEIRERAAAAAAGVLGCHLVPPTATDRLVGWLAEQFHGQDEFERHVVARMTGQTTRLALRQDEVLTHVPAEEQLVKALDFDDSLFATEEQNLFIDEINECIRWRRAFVYQTADGSSVNHLTEWTESGLRYLIGLARKEDGPLGWTSDQHVFAACARVILCAVAVVERTRSTVVSELLEELKVVGRMGRMHRSLLEMAVKGPA
ncbi:thyroid adenoma-associated protein [Echria macrotheca]|uniref:Thyroid adenoma-associated protein n=1 Tax=Echria macrotheca TaxID=438768 RepID=A0AAJ0B320_9PEZI|nr:thyroid adenoma-associated protein [Echria macrotheca]